MRHLKTNALLVFLSGSLFVGASFVTQRVDAKGESKGEIRTPMYMAFEPILLAPMETRLGLNSLAKSCGNNFRELGVRNRSAPQVSNSACNAILTESFQRNLSVGLTLDSCLKVDEVPKDKAQIFSDNSKFCLDLRSAANIRYAESIKVLMDSQKLMDEAKGEMNLMQSSLEFMRWRLREFLNKPIDPRELDGFIKFMDQNTKTNE